MSRTLVIAVILALHVTASLCSLPEPEQELVDKYSKLKQNFSDWLLFYVEKGWEAFEAQIEKHPAAKACIEDLQQNPHVKKTIQIGTDVATELGPLMQKTRMIVLGMYGEYARSWAAPYLDKFIETVKEGVDKILPKEDH